MVAQTTARTSIRSRLTAAFGSALIVASLVATVSPVLADPVSPLTVVKTADKNPVASGQQLTYTIAVQNTGGAKVTNVVLTDQVNGVGVIQNPPALPQLIITSTKGSCVQGGPNGNVVTCNIGQVNGGESFTVTIRGQVTAGNGTTLNNTASVTGTKSAQNFTTTGSVSVLVSGGTGTPLADLTINKTGPTTVAPNAPMTYTLTVTNIGTANATGVRVVDTLPVGMALVSTNASSLFNCTPGPLPAPAVVTCTGGAVNQGQNATITINGTSPATGPLTNTAVVDPNNTITESNELNNTSAAVNTTVGGPPPTPLLTIVKTDGNPAPSGTWWGPGGANPAGPDPVNPGQLITYKILVTNIATGSNSRADDVVTVDGTQGLEASSIVASQVVTNGTVGNTGGCVVTAPQVRCSLRSLNSGGTQLITIIGKVLQSAGSSIFNTATVTGNIKNTGVTNTDSEATTVRPEVDLTITKDDNPDPVCARSWPVDGPPTQHLLIPADAAFPATGDIPAIGLVDDPVCLGGLTYSFVVGNSGIADVNGVTVRDALPAGLIFDSYSSDAGFACSVDAANVVVCTGGSITAVEKTRHLAFMLVAPPNLGTISNTVEIDPDNSIFEPDETNNFSTETTDVTTGIDLTIWKSDNGPEVPPNAADPADDPPGGAPPLTEGFDPIATNGTDTYTIIVDNVGTQNSTGIKVRDTLPAGTKFLSVTSDHGFTCSHDGAATGGNVTCISGHLLGTEAEFYDPAGPAPFIPKDDFATITIKVFVTAFVQPVMHNEVRVDPDNEIAEVNELNNLAIDNTLVGVGDADDGAFNQLKIVKTQTSPVGPLPVATNGTLIYNLHVVNAGTDPVSNVVVKDFLPTGTRFISAADTAPASSARFFCSHDGSATGGVVTCTNGDFSGSLNTIPGVPIQRDITIKVFAPNVPGTYPNLATVDPDNVVAEGNEFDNDSTVETTVTVGGNNMFNELTIAKTQTDPAANQVATSSIVTYNIVVTNAGTDPAFNVRVTDTLPAGFTFISALDLSGPGDPFRFFCVPGAGNTVDCTGATLSGFPNAAPGEPTSRTIEIKARSSATPGDYTNVALVDPANAIPEGNETNNSAQALTHVRVGTPQGFIDLTVTKTASPSVLPGSHVTPGGLITYTIVASNAGTDPAFNVLVRDTLPAGTTFVSAVDTTPPVGPDPNDFTCTHAAGVVNCTGATLDGSIGLAGVPTARTITIVVKAPDANILGLTNVVRVDPDNAIGESSEINNAATAVTDVQSDINLQISKTGPKSAHQNDFTQYVLTVSNDGPAPATGVVVTDPLPTGLIPLVGIVATPGNFACVLTENPVNVVTCVGDLNGKGDSNGFDKVTITIPVFITATGGTLDNQACVDPNNTIVESVETDNCSTNVTPVTAKAPDLLINKSVDKASVTPGDQITYTLSISNNGDADADGPVTVSDTLPAEATFVSSNPDAAFTCPDPVGTALTCTAAAGLTVGQSAQITIIMTVDSPLPSGTTSIENSASVSAGTCTAPCENEAVKPTRLADNSATVTSTVGGSAIDLVMVNGSTFDAPDPVVVGQKLTYTVVVTNAGSAATTTDPAPNSVVVRVTLPAGLDLDSAAASGGFICTPAGPSTGPVGDVDCTGALNAGDNVIVTITTTVTATAGTSLTVVAKADPDDDIVESNEGNNNKTAITSVVAAPCTACIDLVAGSIIVSPPDPVTNNTNVTYNFIVTNVGDQSTNADPAPNDVVVTIDLDTIFNESTPVSASAPGFTCVTTSPPVLLTDPEIVCTNTSGLAAGDGSLFSITAHVNTAGPPPANFVDFDVEVDPGNQIGEFNPANNSASLQIHTHP